MDQETGSRGVAVAGTDEHWAGILNSGLFVAGAAGVAYWLWAFLRGELAEPLPQGMVLLANSASCLCFAVAGLCPRSPHAARFATVAMVALLFGVFLTFLPERS